MSRVSVIELANWIGCKPNQRRRMIAWLDRHHWKYDVDCNGAPAVSQAYFDRKTGASEEKLQAKYADSPNRQAFA